MRKINALFISFFLEAIIYVNWIALTIKGIGTDSQSVSQFIWMLIYTIGTGTIILLPLFCLSLYVYSKIDKNNRIINIDRKKLLYFLSIILIFVFVLTYIYPVNIISALLGLFF